MSVVKALTQRLSKKSPLTYSSDWNLKLLAVAMRPRASMRLNNIMFVEGSEAGLRTFGVDHKPTGFFEFLFR